MSEQNPKSPKKYRANRDGWIAGGRRKDGDVFELTDGGAKYALMTGAISPVEEKPAKAKAAKAAD